MSTPALFSSSEVRFHQPVVRAPGLSFYLLVVFLLFLYASPALLFPALGDFRPTQWVAGLAIAVLLVEGLAAGRGFEWVWPETPLLFAFLAAAALSCITALWSAYAVMSLQDLAKFVAIYFLMVNVIDGVRKLEGAIWAMVIGGLFPALGAVQNFRNNVTVEGRTNWIGIFANPNDLAASLVLLVPLALVVAGTVRAWLRPAVWAIAGLLIVAILLTFSRGGVLGLVAVLVAMAFRRKTGSGRALTVLLLLLSLVFVGFYWSRGEDFSHLSQDSTVQQRLGTIRVGLAMFLDHPLFGVGLGCSVIGWPIYAPTDLSNKWLHNHNTFMQVLSETGIAGFVPFVLLLFVALRDIRRASASCRRAGLERMAAIAEALEVSFLGFLVCAMAGGNALSWFPYILIAAITAAKRIAQKEAVSGA